MNQGKYIYSLFTDFLPKRFFDCIVDKYDGNKHVRFFTCWNQLFSMVFVQLTGRESMRNLMIGLEAHKSKLYHLGFRKNITRSNLSKANESRNYRILEAFAYHQIYRQVTSENSISGELRLFSILASNSRPNMNLMT